MKTHEELGISAEEHEALNLTIGIIEREETRFDMGDICRLHGADVFGEGGRATHPCGTNLCIGGTMSILMQNGMKLPEKITREMSDRARDYVKQYEVAGAFHPLFYSETLSEDRELGCDAIERFLAGNTDDPWLRDVSLDPERN